MPGFLHGSDSIKSRIVIFHEQNPPTNPVFFIVDWDYKMEFSYFISKPYFKRRNKDEQPQ